MIFLTIGTQLPFDRLVNAMDSIAPSLDEEIFAQIGSSSIIPRNFKYAASLSPAEFGERFRAARIVVAHAGIGTILAGMEHQKSLVLMARRSSLGEHRNDHQLATISQMKRIRGIYEAEDAGQLGSILAATDIEAMSNEITASRKSLLGGLRGEIFGVR